MAIPIGQRACLCTRRVGPCFDLVRIAAGVPRLPAQGGAPKPSGKGAPVSSEEAPPAEEAGDPNPRASATALPRGAVAVGRSLEVRLPSSALPPTELAAFEARGRGELTMRRRLEVMRVVWLFLHALVPSLRPVRSQPPFGDLGFAVYVRTQNSPIAVSWFPLSRWRCLCSKLSKFALSGPGFRAGSERMTRAPCPLLSPFFQ